MQRLMRGFLIAAALLLVLTGCEMNIFKAFEDIPVFTADELGDVIPDEFGIDEETGAFEIDEETGGIAVTDPDIEFSIIEEEEDADEEGGSDLEVNEGIRSYVERVNDMVENDTLEELSEEELEVVADNLDAILNTVLDELDLEIIPSEDDDPPADPPETFEEFLNQRYADQVTPEAVEEVREVIQEAASAAAQARLEGDPTAQELIVETGALLANIFGALGGGDTPRSRSLDFTDSDGISQSYENLSDRILLVLEGHKADGTTVYYTLSDDGTGGIQITAENTLPEDGSAALDVTNEFFADGTDLEGMFMDLLPLGELLDFVNTSLAGDDLSMSGAQFADVVITKYLELLAAEDAADDEAEEDAEEEGDDPLVTVYNALVENIGLESLAEAMETFNSMALSARTFATTLDIADDGTVSGITDSFLDNGALNSDGINMATLSALALIFDYGVKSDADDPIGLLPYDALHGMITAEDMYTANIYNEGTDEEYMMITVKYLADLIPSEALAYDPDDFSDGLQYGFFTNLPTYMGDGLSDFQGILLNKAGVVDASGDAVNPEADLRNLKKIVGLLGYLDMIEGDDPEGGLFTQLENQLAELTGGAE